MTPVTPELVEQVRTLRTAGLSLRQIGAQVGRPFTTVQNIVARLAPSAPTPEPPRGCQYPLSASRPWVFCGAAVDRPGSPWCAAHRRICYAGRGSWASAA